MGIYGAINSAVSGLAAQAQALENISGNVANSQTTGYKRLDTSFSDLVSSGGSTQATQVSGTTYATSRATNTVQGDISASDVDTYMAISGEGYFVVTSAADVVDGQTTFEDTSYYTRAGDFELDENNYMVNASGYFLMGFELDEDTGNAVGDSPTVIQISDQPLAAEATENIDYQANLPRVPDTVNYDGSDEDTALLTAGLQGADIAVADETTFEAESISGGSTTIYNQNGTAMDVEIRWAKLLNEDAGVPQDDTWGPAGVIAECRATLPPETLATADSGAHRILLSQMWSCHEPRGLIQSSGLCTMGCAVPLAIGRKLAQPERPVVSFSGDAGFLMVAGELATAAELGLAPIFVVFADASLALIELKQRQRQMTNAGVDFGRHDFAAMGRAFGGHGFTAKNRAELRAALTEALHADRFTVIAAEIEAGGYDGRI